MYSFTAYLNFSIFYFSSPRIHIIWWFPLLNKLASTVSAWSMEELILSSEFSHALTSVEVIDACSWEEHLWDDFFFWFCARLSFHHVTVKFLFVCVCGSLRRGMQILRLKNDDWHLYLVSKIISLGKSNKNKSSGFFFQTFCFNLKKCLWKRVQFMLPFIVSRENYTYYFRGPNGNKKPRNDYQWIWFQEAC